MDLKKLAFSLTLSASVFAGCGDDSGSTTSTTVNTQTTSTTQTIIDVGTCGDAGAAVEYRLNSLHIPTPDEADEGDVVGHNVDGINTDCGADDYNGGVDNSLIELADALPALAGGAGDPIDLQEEIDTALNCAVDATDCTRLDLIVSIATGTGCVRVSVADGDGTNLAGPFVGSLDGAGNMRGQVPNLDLTIPYTSEGSTVDIDLSVTSVIITGNLSATALTNVIIGGALIRADFEATIMSILPALGDTIMFEDIAPLLMNLYDVRIGGTCGALSVGLLATGALNTPAAL